MADGGAFAAVKAASIYALPQAAWLSYPSNMRRSERPFPV
jgi:hypothetical protein